MSDSISGWKSEEQKSLRELSAALTSFAESQAQIKSIFGLYDHDSDGFLTTSQTTLVMRKLGFAVPKSWDYVYRDAVTLPLVRKCCMLQPTKPFCLRFSVINLNHFI